MSKTIIVVPCYNEELRLDVEQFRQAPDFLTWLFVNDGSTDKTEEILNKLHESEPERFLVHSLEKNSGKGEAVRQGLLQAQILNADILGFFDSDLATPIEELIRIMEIFETSGKNICLASRIRLLGSQVERSAARHYIGRVFATLSSLVLGLPVYDTQCGAKIFLPNQRFLKSISQPFLANWLFDVELIGRLCALGATEKDFKEIPLETWNDVPGSKLKTTDGLVALFDLLKIFFDFRKPNNRWKILATSEKSRVL